MATALVGSPTSAGSSRAEQERQFSRDSGSSSSGLQQADAGPPAETLLATREMCAYCFGEVVGVHAAFRGLQRLNVEHAACSPSSL